MDIADTSTEYSPEAWELQSFRKTFKGRTVEVLPEAWELRSFLKPLKGTSCYEKDRKRDVHHESNIETEIIMLLAMRCLQRSEIEDFSISYNAEERPSITLKYIVEGDRHEKRLHLLIRYVPEDSENKRMFKSEIVDTFLDVQPNIEVFTNIILYTNLEWKQKSTVLEKINFQSNKAREAYNELHRLCITNNCYYIGDLRERIKDIYSGWLKGFLYYESFDGFVVAAEQPSAKNMRREIQKYFENEYKLNPIQSTELVEIFHDSFFATHPWIGRNCPMKKQNVVATLEDLIQKLDALLMKKLVVEGAEIAEELQEGHAERKLDEG